jgi:hypothetical protein
MAAEEGLMNPLSVRLLLVFLAVAAADAAFTQSLRGQPLLLGTWQLDLSRSTYFPGPPPRGETRTYTADSNGVLGIIKRVHANGQTETIEYRADFDREHAVTGTPAYDSIKLKMIDELTAESTLSHAGTVFGTARRVISQDGNSLTIMFVRKTSDDTVRNIAIYRRVP